MNEEWPRNTDILPEFALVTINISIGIGTNMLGINKIIGIDIYKITKASEGLIVHYSF